METRLLIDGIVRQTTVLIAQLLTAAGFGDATLSFDLYPGHPEQAAVYGLLDSLAGAQAALQDAAAAEPVIEQENS